MQHFGPFSVAIAFWIFVTVAAVAAVTTGIRAPLRLRHAGLVAIAAAAVTLWTALQSS